MTVSRSFVLCLSATIHVCILYAQADAVSPPVLGRLVDIGGRRVHIYCTGQGSPAVVVAGGFSFDWGLVQAPIAQVTRICTYDPAGTAWSDPDPAQTDPTCTGRVSELHQLLVHAGVKGPYLLVGYSIGALVMRLYAAEYGNEIAGEVLVDHAFIDTPRQSEPRAPSPSLKALDSPPQLISETPITLDMRDDQNFSKLPARNRQLHVWARSHSYMPTPAMAAGCFSEVDKGEKRLALPLGNRPIAVVSTLYDSPEYAELQERLLGLSKNSKQLVARNSTHMVTIDEPEVVVKAIQEVTFAARNHALLSK